ncbi:MAG: hypothetical protein M1834_006105 [Cirrosporium novae-zelandiae]|nr:MAG: hypothetical protein M1834_006105 [Cirrosporium novae-zelandiae]
MIVYPLLNCLLLSHTITTICPAYSPLTHHSHPVAAVRAADIKIPVLPETTVYIRNTNAKVSPHRERTTTRIYYTESESTRSSSPSSSSHYQSLEIPYRPTRMPSIVRRSSPPVAKTAPKTSHSGMYAVKPAGPAGRPPYDDESYVMKTFSKHYRTCNTCSLTQRELCAKGMSYAVEVTEYVFRKAGRHYSVIDGQQLTEIDFPKDCDATRRLLKLVEDGMVLNTGKPRPKSWDATYGISNRPVGGEPIREMKPNRHVSFSLEPERNTSTKKTERHHRDPAKYPDRGSLYYKDMEDRRRWRQEEENEPAYYVVSAHPSTPYKKERQQAYYR